MFEQNNAAIYYETAGNGQPIVFIHAGVADSRQWNNEFESLSDRFHVIRYNQRGFGKSEPVDGDFSFLDDLLDHLELDQPAILVGCSMGGGTALDYALHNPDKVSAPVMVDSAPSTLRLDVPEPEKFKWVAEAEKAGDLELVGELETQIWFDGDRDTRDIDQQMRKLAYDMNLIALRHDTKGLGSQRDNLEEPAVNRSGEIKIPVLTILGSNDIPYMHVALDFLKDHISGIQTATIQDAAHLPNLDQPEAFEKLLLKFIEGALT